MLKIKICIWSYNEIDYLFVSCPFCLCVLKIIKRLSAYKPNNQLLFIVSRVLHRIIKLERYAFSFIILCITLETIKSRWLFVTYMLKCVLNRSIYSSKPFNILYIARSSSIDQKSVRVWFVHWSRNAKCVVTRVLAVCEHWACARVQHISHIINSFLLFLVCYTE